MFDSIGIAILAGTFFANLGIHSAIVLVMGIAIFFGLFYLSHTEKGFWIIGGIMSLAWGLILTAIIAGEKDNIWQTCQFVLQCDFLELNPLL